MAEIRSALRNRLVVFGAGIVVAMVVLALAAGVVTPYDPTEMKVVDSSGVPVPPKRPPGRRGKPGNRPPGTQKAPLASRPQVPRSALRGRPRKP